MEKEKLQTYYKVLNKMYEDFLLFERDSKHGRTKKIRETANGQLQTRLTTFERYVLRNPGLYTLITSPEVNFPRHEPQEFGRHLIWDEFKSVRYFTNDMKDFLARLKRMIDSIKAE